MENQFNFSGDLLDNYLHGDCFILALCIQNILKHNKIKSTVIFTSTIETKFLHVCVYLKNNYIDISGIHSYDGLVKNHKENYKLTCDDLFIDDVNDYYGVTHYNYYDDDFKNYTDKIAKRIVDSDIFKKFISKNNNNL